MVGVLRSGFPSGGTESELLSLTADVVGCVASPNPLTPRTPDFPS